MNTGYSYTFWNDYGIKVPLKMDLRSHPSLLLTGASGSGKSYALKYMLSNLLENKVDITFCNFKNSADFKFMTGYKHYHTFTDCSKGLEQFYDNFKEVQGSDTEFSGMFRILIFDEYPAFVLYTTACDKKIAERYKTMISELLMLGRSYGYGVWLVMQRPDSSLLANGARDNFHLTISLGNISKEAKSMLYSGEELPQRVYKAGEGICWIDGMGLCEIKFPRILDIQSREARILNRLTDATGGKQ